MQQPLPAPRTCATIPHLAWYAVATPDDVGRDPLARTVLGEPVVLYRTRAGEVAALADRCLHRPVPLSRGQVGGDDLIAAYTGFRYAADGRLLSVPTQPHVPYDARVRAYPVREDGASIWIWMGRPELARLRPPPSLPWLEQAEWHTIGDSSDTEASLNLMLENFANLAHVPFVDPVIAPPALSSNQPIHVQVTETTVAFHRDFQNAALPAWQAELTGVPTDSTHRQREEAAFVSPGVWVSRWSTWVHGHGDADGEQKFIFSHLLTPVTGTRTRHTWRVSRNFAAGAAGDATIRHMFASYYARERELLELMQTTVGDHYVQPVVRVAMDAAASHVERIMGQLVAEERS